MSNNNPLVSVLLPVYDGEKYLSQAIASILGQTFSDFELLIINDGSRDGTLEIIKSFDDQRIRLVNNEKNFGLVHSLNIGLELARGKYLARMDADDISSPKRLARQLSFLESHPDIAICGSAIKLLGGSWFNRLVRKYINDEEIKISFLLENPLAHPAVMIRRQNGHFFNYDPSFKYTEDYELWTRISNGVKFANINHCLLKYRIHANQKSQLDYSLEKENEMIKIIHRYFEKLSWPVSINELSDNYHLLFNNPRTLDDLKFIESWLRRLVDFNNKHPQFSSATFNRVIVNYWFKICFNFSLTLKGPTRDLFGNFARELSVAGRYPINISSQLKLAIVNLINYPLFKVVVKLPWRFKNYLQRKILIRKFYKTNFNQTINLNTSTDLADKNIIDIVSIAFNNSAVIGYQIKLLRKNILDPYFYTVIDNSSDAKERYKIFDLCRQAGVAYVGLPPNPLSGSLSHGLALNWTWKNYLRFRGPKYFGFIDHDIFPIKPVSIIPFLEKQKIYGHWQERHGQWYLWPGFCFLDFDYLNNKKINFLPKEGIVDTGGRNYWTVFRYLDKDNIFFPDDRLEKIRDGGVDQADYVHYIDGWLHTLNASGWMKIKDPAGKEKIITNLLDTYLNSN